MPPLAADYTEDACGCAMTGHPGRDFAACDETGAVVDRDMLIGEREHSKQRARPRFFFFGIAALMLLLLDGLSLDRS